MEPVHGGGLNAAARRWAIPVEQWLDLSTGINPWAWPVPAIPGHVWQRLPEDDDGLLADARRWLGASERAGIVPLPGSQAAIQLLPRLRSPCRVIVPSPGYAEHACRWEQAGHRVRALAPEAMASSVDDADVAVWVQPRNPDGRLLPPATLLDWHARLARRGGWLLVDEAFIDVFPAYSLAPHAGLEGLLILRSFGKFFGLAGARGGFLMAPEQLAAAVRSALGPWAVSGPTRWLMRQAMADVAWQTDTRKRLAHRSERLCRRLSQVGLEPTGNGRLFVYCRHPRAAEIHQQLAARGILLRLFDTPPALRIGIPATADAEQRLIDALAGAV